MHARSTTIKADPEKLDAGIAYVRDEVLPTVQQIDGCIGLSMLTDRESGRCIVATAWANEQAMRATAAEDRAVQHPPAAHPRRRARRRPGVGDRDPPPGPSGRG